MFAIDPIPFIIGRDESCNLKLTDKCIPFVAAGHDDDLGRQLLLFNHKFDYIQMRSNIARLSVPAMQFY